MQVKYTDMHQKLPPGRHSEPLLLQVVTLSGFHTRASIHTIKRQRACSDTAVADTGCISAERSLRIDDPGGSEALLLPPLPRCAACGANADGGGCSADQSPSSTADCATGA
mmetsp:Transcript_20002/g.59427  ORF Transcript_20002/g.59427 Transcript_20002/m.59427 type:complete len:111 (+) Transcript_20002:249-581(+)|eukprot:352911-Chlamydomonas_euryale.AAC.15